MNEMQIFNNPDFGSIRAVILNGDPWFAGKDVAEALGYRNPHEAIRDHVDDEDKGVSDSLTPGGNQKVVVINESGLYSLIFSSKLPSAKRFKHWVTSVVLPAIRKNGGYTLHEEEQEPEAEPEQGTVRAEHRELTPDDYIKAAQIIATCRNERLPYVMGFLSQSGLSIPSLSPVPNPNARDNAGDTAKYILLAKQHGLNQNQIAVLTGLHRNQIGRIALGQSKPKRDRADYIIQTIKDAIPNLPEPKD